MSTKQFACVKSKPIIAIGAPVTVEAGAKDEAGNQGPPKFVAEFYTGIAMDINGWDLPVVVDLAGLQEGKSLVANQYHDSTRPVGNFALANDGKSLVANGTATANTTARDEVIGSALNGFNWQASLEVTPLEVEAVKKGKTAQANGRTFEGPVYITRKGVLKGFAFVSHGADDNTSATIAAIAASKKEQKMKPEVKAWVESLGLSAEDLTAEQVANFEADYAGREGKRTVKAAVSSSPFEAHKIEAKRREELRNIADTLIERRGGFISQDEIIAIEKMYDHAIEANMTPTEFRIELYEATVPMGHTVRASVKSGDKLTGRILEAAVCQAGNLKDIEKHFTDQELQAAHTKFREGISLNQLMVLAAEANGYHGTTGGRVTPEVQNAAMGMLNGPYSRIHGSGGGFSTVDLANVVAATANKFKHEGWMAVDLTPLEIASVRPVRNFQQITTVSLTGDLQFSKIGGDGEIKHGTLDDLTYTNQADTYATMLSIARKDIINDDLGCLTAVPRRLGRGGALKLNDIFWTEFLGLVSANFFASGNSNINTAVADMTIGGLKATETIFLNQTDPDGKPLGIMPKIILVPTALKAEATSLMDSQKLITGSDVRIGESNPFAGRFQVKSSPYISNSSYTGNTAVGWWMLADPSECPVIEIVALNGRVEPTVETADADFNVLGIRMRGYSDIGVNDQEKRGGVYADGGAS